jgi:hypothetical protein
MPCREWARRISNKFRIREAASRISFGDRRPNYFFARPRGTDAATFQNLCHTEVGTWGRVEAHCWYGTGTRPALQRHADEASAACPHRRIVGGGIRVVNPRPGRSLASTSDPMRPPGTPLPTASLAGRSERDKLHGMFTKLRGIRHRHGANSSTGQFSSPGGHQSRIPRGA